MKQHGTSGAPSASRISHVLLKVGSVFGMLACCFPVICASSTSQKIDSIIVETSLGKVRGTVQDGIYVFKGIPYAASPAGANRFKPPGPPHPWGNVRDALKYGPTCMQPPAPRGDAFLASQPPMSEDCLVLNIWTPRLAGNDLRPVLVAVHGGGFGVGSASDVLGPGGGAVAKRGNLVTVNVNHRLGVLGYLYLGQLADKGYAASGNAGLLDLIAALQWVHENISRFGGDPANVTLFGQSGGANKISMLLAMPEAKGLFQRATLQSGGLLRGLTPDQATRHAAELLGKLHVAADQLDKLQTLPAQQLVQVAGTSAFAPVVDGVALPYHPFDPVAADVSADVALIVGTNGNEFPNLADWYSGPEPSDDSQAAALLQQLSGVPAETILPLYRAQDSHATPGVLLARILSDLAYPFESIKLAERKQAQNRAPVFMYRFDWQPLGAASEKHLASSHGREIPFVTFGFRVPQKSAQTAVLSKVALADSMSRAWAAFATVGNPDVPGLPHWPPYNTDSRATMIFNTESTVVLDPDGLKRAALKEINVERH